MFDILTYSIFFNRICARFAPNEVPSRSVANFSSHKNGSFELLSMCSTIKDPNVFQRTEQ